MILSDFSDTTLLTVNHRRGWESLWEILVSCPSMIIQEFYSNMHGFDSCVPRFVTHVRGSCIVVTLELISEVLHVPRVSHPNYPGCPCLRTVSKDELLSFFCETPSSWGDRQNTLYSGFAKGSRFLNMGMTFVLYPLSQYNSITEPRARFFLSLIDDVVIIFFSLISLCVVSFFSLYTCFLCMQSLFLFHTKMPR